MLPTGLQRHSVVSHTTHCIPWGGFAVLSVSSSSPGLVGKVSVRYSTHLNPCVLLLIAMSLPLSSSETSHRVLFHTPSSPLSPRLITLQNAQPTCSPLGAFWMSPVLASPCPASTFRPPVGNQPNSINSSIGPHALTPKVSSIELLEFQSLLCCGFQRTLNCSVVTVVLKQESPISCSKNNH